LVRLFNPSDGTGAAAGILYHAWFATIGWLDDGPPTETSLRAIADKLHVSLPMETWRERDKLLQNFKSWLGDLKINALLRRSAYANPKQESFPSQLTSLWSKTFRPQQVELERRFVVRDGSRFWNGSFDRIVWLGDGTRTIAADVIDFKTDAIGPGDAAALKARTDHYRPQAEAYRKAVARLADLPVECISARLVFPMAGQVVDV
jgi:ATP-dependent exoDNAse (exonuclease V) beta subunit